MAIDSNPSKSPIPNDVLVRTDIEPSIKLVFLIMSIESAGCGSVMASDGYLAGKCGLSRPTVIAARVLLEELGLIAKTGEPVNQVYRYQFLHPEMLGSGAILPEMKTTRKSVAAQTATPQCRECRATRAVDEVGICAVCRKQYSANMEVAKLLNQEPWTTKEDTWTRFRSRSRGVRYSNAQLETAWVTWNRDRRKMESA